LPPLKDIIKAVLNEAKDTLKEYFQETETNLKKRFKRLLIISITSSILLALAISLIGSASLFILIGSLKYLETFMPAWEAWYITGLTSAAIAAVLLGALFFIIWKQLKSPEPSKEQK
jgi:uncharacterized BrkB/YihY/UPF0761 family membrane protein